MKIAPFEYRLCILHIGVGHKLWRYLHGPMYYTSSMHVMGNKFINFLISILNARMVSTLFSRRYTFISRKRKDTLMLKYTV